MEVPAGPVLLSGRLNFKRHDDWERPGSMYRRRAKKTWVFRQTGIMVAVPEIWGHIFVGRSKEGFSLNKVMIGYAGWGIERAPISDATLPILADGVKWLGDLPRARILWTLGGTATRYRKGSRSPLREPDLGRFVWVPALSASGRMLVHLGVSQSYGKVNNATLRLRARSGAWGPRTFLDTGDFAAATTRMTGFEAYYRPGPFTFGLEYFLQRVDAPASGDPLFHGGDAAATWLITGETRTYNTRGGDFNGISPNRPVFAGGPGAWEVVGHFSNADPDGGAITGGTFWRLTPLLNLYISDHVRLAFVYGYGSLDRSGLAGKTRFFQTRLQLQL